MQPPTKVSDGSDFGPGTCTSGRKCTDRPVGLSLGDVVLTALFSEEAGEPKGEFTLPKHIKAMLVVVSQYIVRNLLSGTEVEVRKDDKTYMVLALFLGQIVYANFPDEGEFCELARTEKEAKKEADEEKKTEDTNPIMRLREIRRTERGSKLLEILLTLVSFKHLSCEEGLMNLRLGKRRFAELMVMEYTRLTSSEFETCTRPLFRTVSKLLQQIRTVPVAEGTLSEGAAKLFEMMRAKYAPAKSGCRISQTLEELCKRLVSLTDETLEKLSSILIPIKGVFLKLSGESDPEKSNSLLEQLNKQVQQPKSTWHSWCAGCVNTAKLPTRSVPGCPTDKTQEELTAAHDQVRDEQKGQSNRLPPALSAFETFYRAAMAVLEKAGVKEPSFSPRSKKNPLGMTIRDYPKLFEYLVQKGFLGLLRTKLEESLFVAVSGWCRGVNTPRQIQVFKEKLMAILAALSLVDTPQVIGVLSLLLGEEFSDDSGRHPGIECKRDCFGLLCILAGCKCPDTVLGAKNFMECQREISHCCNPELVFERVLALVKRAKAPTNARDNKALKTNVTRFREMLVRVESGKEKEIPEIINFSHLSSKLRAILEDKKNCVEEPMVKSEKATTSAGEAFWREMLQKYFPPTPEMPPCFPECIVAALQRAEKLSSGSLQSTVLVLADLITRIGQDLTVEFDDGQCSLNEIVLRLMTSFLGQARLPESALLDAAVLVISRCRGAYESELEFLTSVHKAQGVFPETFFNKLVFLMEGDMPRGEEVILMALAFASLSSTHPELELALKVLPIRNQFEQDLMRFADSGSRNLAVKLIGEISQIGRAQSSVGQQKSLAEKSEKFAYLGKLVLRWCYNFIRINDLIHSQPSVNDMMPILQASAKLLLEALFDNHSRAVNYYCFLLDQSFDLDQSEPSEDPQGYFELTPLEKKLGKLAEAEEASLETEEVVVVREVVSETSVVEEPRSELPDLRKALDEMGRCDEFEALLGCMAAEAAEIQRGKIEALKAKIFMRDLKGEDSASLVEELAELTSMMGQLRLFVEYDKDFLRNLLVLVQECSEWMTVKDLKSIAKSEAFQKLSGSKVLLRLAKGAETVSQHIKELMAILIVFRRTPVLSGWDKSRGIEIYSFPDWEPLFEEIEKLFTETQIPAVTIMCPKPDVAKPIKPAKLVVDKPVFKTEAEIQREADARKEKALAKLVKALQKSIKIDVPDALACVANIMAALEKAGKKLLQHQEEEDCCVGEHAAQIANVESMDFPKQEAALLNDFRSLYESLGLGDILGSCPDTFDGALNLVKTPKLLEIVGKLEELLRNFRKSVRTLTSRRGDLEREKEELLRQRTELNRRAVAAPARPEESSDVCQSAPVKKTRAMKDAEQAERAREKQATRFRKKAMRDTYLHEAKIDGELEKINRTLGVSARERAPKGQVRATRVALMEEILDRVGVAEDMTVLEKLEAVIDWIQDAPWSLGQLIDGLIPIVEPSKYIASTSVQELRLEDSVQRMKSLIGSDIGCALIALKKEEAAMLEMQKRYEEELLAASYDVARTKREIKRLKSSLQHSTEQASKEIETLHRLRRDFVKTCEEKMGSAFQDKLVMADKIPDLRADLERSCQEILAQAEAECLKIEDKSLEEKGCKNKKGSRGKSRKATNKETVEKKCRQLRHDARTKIAQLRKALEEEISQTDPCVQCYLDLGEEIEKIPQVVARLVHEKQADELIQKNLPNFEIGEVEVEEVSSCGAYGCVTGHLCPKCRSARRSQKLNLKKEVLKEHREIILRSIPEVVLPSDGLFGELLNRI